MSRETIEVRECDRCKQSVEARGVESFEGWGSANATGQKQGERAGFANADLCPQCFNFIVEWFQTPARERDAQRTFEPRKVVPPIREIAAKLISDSLDLSPDMVSYLDQLEKITNLDDLQEYQAKNALILMQWLSSPETAERIKDKHREIFERLEGSSQTEDAQS